MVPSQFYHWMVQCNETPEVLSSSTFQGFISLLLRFGTHLSSSAGQSEALVLWKLTLAVVSQ